MDIRELLEISKHKFHYGTEAEIQNYSDRVMEVAGLLKKNPDNVVIGNPPKTTPKVPLPTIQKDPKQGGFIPGIIETPEFTYPKEKYYVPKAIYDAAVKFNEEYDKAAAKSEEANRNQKRKNLLIAFTAKNGVVMGDDPRLNDLLDPNNPRLGTVGQAIKDFGAAPKVEGEEEFGVLDAAKKQKILDDVIGFKKFQNETPSFKKQPSDIIEDITKPKQLDGQTFYNNYALNRHLKDKELQSITEKAAQEISKKYWLAGDISEFASKRISDEEAKNKKLNADIHNIVNGHKVVSVRDENYKYSKLTEDEKMLYNYFVMEQTSDMKTSLAGRYLKALELDLEQRAAVDLAEDMNGIEKGLYLFGHGIGGSLESIANIGGDFGYDPTEGEMLASAIIEGEEDDFAKFVYQSISTVSEQIPALAVGFASGGAGYSAVLSANIMSKSIKEAMQNNKTLIQGISYGAVQASMELALERMLGGIGGKFLGKGSSGIVVKTLNKIDDIFTGRIPKALLKGAVVRLENGVGEFTQEFIQGITDPAIKNIIYQENNTYSLGTLNEALYQGLLGAVSGMFLGGGANAAQTTAYYETLGDTLSDSQVLDFAKEAGNIKSELYRELSEKARKGKELTAVERGMLSKETTDLIYNNSTFTKETLKFMATEGSVKQISDLLFDGNTEAAEAFKAKFSDSEYVDSLMFGENDRVDASFVEQALNPAAPETDATEAMAEGQTAPTAEGIASEGTEAVATETESATDSIAHPAPTAGKVLKMTPVSAKAKSYVKDIAKRLGTNLEFVDMAAELAKRGQNIEGLVIYPEGFYDPETHTLYVGNEVSNPVEFVFKHELTHYGERSKYYAAFARAVRNSKAFKKWLDTQATYTAKDTAGKELQLHLILKERYEKVKNLTEPEAQREVVANFVADVLFKGDVETLSEILNEATPTQKNAVMRFLSDFFNWIKSKFTGSKQIVSEIADLENMFRELIGDAAVNPMPTESGITYDTAETEANESMSVAEANTDSTGAELSKGQRKYFALSKVRDAYGRLLRLYHGTANGEFYTYDRSKGNVENDFGLAHYFTNNESDVTKNYEGGGPDFDAKVRRRANEIANERGIEYEQAEQMARKELFKGSNKHTVYVRMVNPAIVGETNLLDPQKYLEQTNNDYDAAKALAEKDISKIYWAVKRKLGVENVNELIDVLWNAVNQGGIGIEQLKSNIGKLRYTDNNGNRLGNEVTRQVIESLGYDGIIDPTVSSKWNMDIEEGTVHYIVFNSEQIKDVNNRKPTEDKDIRYSVPASEGAVNEKTAEEVGVELDEKTESVSPLSFSLASWERSDYVTKRDKASAELAEALGISKKKANAYIDSINGIAKVIADSRIRLDYISSKGRSSFVSNAEYGGSIDFSTLCKKRRILTGTFSAIQKALRHSALTAEEILDIRNRLKEKGLEVSCGLCYVEGSRAQMGKFSKEFIERYKKKNPEYVPDMFDVNTPEGVEQLRIDHPEVYEAYEQFWNNKGVLNPGDSVLFASQQKPKLYQMRTEYNNEILEKFKNDDNVNEKNKNGGLRLQSFSDFEIVHLIDTMQVILDMSKVGLAGQAYTKVADFALALGNTGLKINLSLIAKDVDANGNLVFDDVEGMPIDTAMRIRDMYSDNVGTILVIFNDAQLKAALADNRVDFIIPFHRSQWKKVLYEKLGLPKGTKDYTYQQNERYIKPVYYTTKNNTIGKRKATNYMPNEYWDFSKSGKENAEAYLKMCAENNKRPKFYKLLVDNKDGSYSLQPDGSTDGYWKLLIDFKMYNNEGVGVPQQPVKPDFNMEESMRMLEEYKGGHEQFPVDQETVDEFVSEYREKHKMDDFTEQKAEPKSVKTVYDNLSLSVPATDQAYLSAVENGDMDTAQRMVDEAAKEAGYDFKGFHGTPRGGFTVFETHFPGMLKGVESIFLSKDSGTASSYAYGNNRKVYRLFAKIERPLVVDCGSMPANAISLKSPQKTELKKLVNKYIRDAWDHITSDVTEASTDQIGYAALRSGEYDGVVFKTVKDSYYTNDSTDVYEVFTPEQVKSADPVTFDDNGNVIPLSERFNPENNDIRFSVPASEGKAVTSKSLFDKVQKGEISYEEFVKLVDEGWNKAGKTYGVKPDGEMVTANNKPANVPNKVAPGKTVRRFVRNVLEANYSKDFNNALKSETLAKNKGTVYEPQSNAKRVAEARKNLAKRNAESATRQWLQSKESSNPQRIVEGEALLVIAEQEGRTQDALDLTCELATMFTDAAQKLQAATILKRLGSIGKLYYLQRTVNMLNQKISKIYKNAPELSINETLAAQLLETKTDDEADLVINAITADLGQQMPANWIDKWNAWRYMAMLVNPTTHIRNSFGNLLFKPAIFFGELFSATIQKGVGAVKGETFEKTTTFKANKRDKEFARKDWEKNRKKVMSSGKYEDVSEIEDNRRIYKNGILEGIRKGNSYLLEWEDGIFLKNHYIRTLARYLTANKINPETASEAQLRRARDYARKKAQEYTYRDASKFASWMSRSAREHTVVGLFFDGIIPFKKTPINVFRRGIEYSPLGFIKSLTTDLAKLKKGVENDGISLGEWIDGFAASLTGTGLLAFGALLSLWGVVKIDFDDEDEWFRKLSGEQEFSIQIGDFSYTVDWAAPSSMPFFMGATYAQVQSDENTHWFDNLLDSAMSGLNPMVELSMLQGVNDLLESLSYGGDDYVPNFVGTSLTSYFSQGLPTVGGKLANLIDDTRRTKYIEKNGSNTLQNMYDIIAKKVPFLSKTRAEYIDAWGREQYTGNVIERFFAQFVSPGYASTIDPDPIYDELKAIKESTGEAGVYPKAPEKEITFGGVKRHLSKEEYYNVATMSGQTKMNLVNEAMDHKYYDKLTDEQKAEVIMNIYKYSNSLAITSELDFTLDEIKAGLGDKKGSVLTESRWNSFSFEQQQYLTHEAFMDGVITAYKYEQNGGSAAEYFILKALKNN